MWGGPYLFDCFGQLEQNCMTENLDYFTEENKRQAYEIARIKNLYLYQVGQLCGIQDKGFWSRIMNSIKPIPLHAREKFQRLYQEVSQNE